MSRKKFEKGKLYQIPLEDLQPDPMQPRKYLDPASLQELTLSVMAQGVLQPVLVRQTEDGELRLVSGERRYQASVQAGLPTIPALVTDGDPAEVAIVENLMREGLTAIEEAEAIAALKDSHQYGLADLSKVLGKSESTLCDILCLMKLPAEIKEECRKNSKVSRTFLLEVSRQASQRQMKTMYKRLKSGGQLLGELRLRQRSNPVPQDLTFISRFTQRITALEPGNLDAAQGETVLNELEALHRVIRNKINILNKRPAAAS